MRDSSLQSSSAGWAHHANRALGTAADEGPAALGAAERLALCPPPLPARGGLAPCQLSFEGRARQRAAHGETLAKDPAMLLDDVQLSQAAETSVGLGW